MSVDEVEIYEPLENSNLISIIPKDDKILYSAIFEVFNRFLEIDKWRSHVILTDKGVAISSSVFILIPNGCGVKVGDYYFFPWHAVQRSQSHSTRLAIGNYHLRLEANKDLEAIKPIDVMDKELMERSEILIKQSKDELYEKLLPILKSYPKAFLPMDSAPRFSMLSKVYIELRVRYNKEVGKGIFKYRSKVKPISKKTYYSKERIIEEIRNYNCEPGTYDELMKKGEMAVVFANFFGKHSVEEAVNLILELFEINPIFVSNWYSIVHNIIVQRFPRKEKDLYEFENIIAEQIHFKLLFKADEYIIVDFKGTVNIPKAHLKYPGHIYITNYQLIVPNVPLIKRVYPSTMFYPPGIITSGISLIAGVIKAGVKAHIEGARKELGRGF